MAYVNLVAHFVYEMQTVFGDFNKLANNDAFIKDNGWQDGTVGVFFQAASPVGWTKVVTIDARALRLVSGGGGGTGGTQDPSATITLAHTHVVSNQVDHTHVLQAHTAYLANAGTDQFNGVGTNRLIEMDGSDPVNFDSGDLARSIISGIAGKATKKNEMPMTGGPYTTGAGGAHDHGAVTDSQLADLSLAYINVLFASKDTSSGYTDLTATFVHDTRQVFEFLNQLAGNDDYNYQRRTPAGTVSLFGSAATPVGWTKLTSQDAKLIRMVSGTGGGSGGVTDPATTITLAHTHGDLTSGGAHTHSMPAHTHKLADNATIFAVGQNPFQVTAGQLRDFSLSAGTPQTRVKVTTPAGGSGTSTSQGTHQHALGSSLSDISLAYFNVIQASKDSTGAPSSYTDMTTFFVPPTTDPDDAPLLAYQELNTMADNDAYLYFHTMPSAAIMFFFQSSAPLNWTKITSQNDVLLRIVSGATGGSGGGSGSLSGGITLAHTHTIDAKSHTHSLDHTHTLDTGRVASGTVIGSRRVFGAHGAEMYEGTTGGATDNSLGNVTDTVTVATDSVSHNHTGLTASALSNVALAYADVIQCSKN